MVRALTLPCPLALYAAPAVLMPMVVFSGVLYQRSAVPWYLTWLHDASMVNFGYAALLRSQARALPPEVSSCRYPEPAVVDAAAAPEGVLTVILAGSWSKIPGRDV